MRTLTITAAEWASVQDGTLWLVREGEQDDPMLDGHCPPVEFTLASAPCDVCDDTRLVIFRNGDLSETYYGPTPCPDCRIELEITDGFAFPVVVGHAYAVGQPCLIDMVLDVRGVAIADVDDATEVVIPLDRLAHYGPPESLVGQWALQLKVVGS